MDVIASQKDKYETFLRLAANEIAEEALAD
jgi:hypothetical protein